MKFLRKLWRGEKGLVFTFWAAGFFLPLTLNLTLRAMNYHNLNGVYIKEGQQIGDFWYITLPLMAYTWFVSISIWRAATLYIASRKTENSSLWCWGQAAKVFVVLSILGELLRTYTFITSI